MSWYSDGTIQVAANGTVATGTGTAFIGNARIGDGIAIAGSATLHEVTGVSSNTQLTFQPPYAGAAGSGKAYRVVPVLGYDKDLSDAFNQIRVQWGAQLSSLQPWSTAATAAAARVALGIGTAGDAVFVAATQAAARTAMGLGTAATANRQVSVTDATNGAVLTMLSTIGPFGLGGNPVQRRSLAQIDSDRGCEFFDSNLSSAENPFGSPGAGVHVAYPASSRWWEMFVPTVGVTAVRAFLRSALGSSPLPPVELIHSGNAGAMPITGALAPATDNNVSYGAAARRPSVLYAGTGTINTSDAREKTEVRELTASELAAAQELGASIGAYRWLDQVESKGEEAREHIGMTVQKAISILESHGLEPFTYGFICYDSWPEETVQHPAEYEEVEIPAVYEQVRVAPLYDADGNVAVAEHFVDGREIQPARVERGAIVRDARTEVLQTAGDRYSFRMDELYAFIAAGANQRANELDRRLKLIESALDAGSAAR
jgi:hypothetical protein